MIRKTALILAAMAMSIGSASAAYVTDAFTLSDIDTLVVGDKTFSDFSVGLISVPGGAVADVADHITVRGFINAGIIGIEFQNPYLAGTDEILDLTINYTVTAGAGWLINGIGQGITPNLCADGCDASASLTEIVRNLGGTTVGDSTVGFTASFEDFEDPFAEGSDTLWFDGEKTLLVSKDYNFFGATDSKFQTGVSAIRQTFYQTPDGDIPPVPEPATMLLFSTALLGLGFMRRKKS
jgi:hypothetical protein